MNGKSMCKKIWNVTTTLLVIFFVLVAMFLMGMRLIGLRPFTVVSGSMEPKYMVGDLLYVREVNPSEIKVGDAITFVMNEELTVASHEVIAIDTEKQHFYTKGIANDTPDQTPVLFKNLIGKPVFSIAKLGYVSAWIQNPPGTYITVAFGVMLLILLFLPDMLKKAKKTDSAQEKVVVSEELEQMRAELEAVKAELDAARSKIEDAPAEAESTPDRSGDES